MSTVRFGADGGTTPALAAEHALHAELSTLLGAPVEVLPEVGSTNQELAERAREAAVRGGGLPDLSLLATDYQSAGRGRLDRSWVVAPGEALTFSLLLRPSGPSGAPLATQTFGWLTMLLSTAVAQALSLQGIAAQVKWPNDVLVGDRKMVGVLASLVPFDHLPPAVVVGAGINVSTTELPVHTATSVLREGGDPNRGELLRQVVQCFLPLYRSFCADPTQLAQPHGSLRHDVEALLGTLGRRVRAQLPGNQPPLVGVAAGLDQYGALLLDDDAGARHHLSAADVVHLRGAQEDV
ncbi:biotin--[acetyl-CoA-carboxylase] ligase [Kocuria sp.]|uniref:biotin--[acetyl-CoA-carboxylase] ligase n=1 Tax=Kocuria sp. TaxID=1871328 RepID=UPI0026E10030|nr:biotin--[acetyl-CoA-carboxylase] ligase [Kocuria sp.]MDO5619120.1 biotin--[acetyl-CoA-carboxylase] ligase [Kocuria sp.]